MRTVFGQSEMKGQLVCQSDNIFKAASCFPVCFVASDLGSQTARGALGNRENCPGVELIVLDRARPA